MSSSLIDYAHIYVQHMSLFQETPEAFFYPNPCGQQYNRMPVSQRIKKIMREAGIADDGVGVLRTHSIRHSYAVRILKKMQEEGVDVYCSLPLLAAYLGHSDIKSTEYYLRLIGEEHSAIADAMAAYNEIIFPEVD
jgi:integrase